MKARRPAGGVPAVELVLWIAVAGALLFLDPYGDFGPESDRFLLLQALAAIGAALALGGRGTSATSQAGALTPPARSPVATAALAWAGAAVVAALFSIDRWRSLLGAPPRLAGLVSELALVALFFVAVVALASPAARDRLGGAIVAAAAALAAYGVMQWIGLDPLAWDSDWQGRPVAAQGNPLFLAQAIVWLAPLLAGRALDRYRSGARGEGLALAALAAVAVALLARTGARGAWLGLSAAALVVGVGLYAARPARRVTPPESGASRRTFRWPLAVAMAAIALAGLGALGGALAGGALAGTAGQRGLLWRACGALLAASPPERLAVGYGQESLASALAPYLPAELPGRVWSPDLYHDRAHNAALDALLSGGALRLLAGLALVVAGLVAAARRVSEELEVAEEKEGAHGDALGWLAGLTGYSVALATGVATAASSLFFWLALARVARPASPAPSGTRAGDEIAALGARARTVCACIALVFVLFVGIVPAQTGGGGARAALLLAAAAAAALLAIAGGRRSIVALRPALIFGALFGLLLLLLRASPVPGAARLALAGALVAIAAVASRGGEEGRTPARRVGRLELVAWTAAALALGGIAVEFASGGLLKRGRTRLAVGEVDAARADLRAAARWTPWIEEVPLALARAELRAAERATDAAAVDAGFRAAESAIEAAGRFHPRSALLALERGHLLARWSDASHDPEPRRERLASAVESFRAALLLDPQNAVAHRSLGAALLELGDPAAARGALARSVALAPRSVEGRLMSGRAALAEGDVAAARAEFAAAHSIDAARARQIVETLARARPTDASAFRDLGLLDLVDGRPDRAELALKRAMAIARPDELGAIAALLSQASSASKAP